jgi:membrane associated rhomboid family serine protease
MLIPLRHENMEGRRWPVITFTLIVLNILIFLGTHWKMEEQEPERAEVRTHLILLAGTHPELKTSADVERFISDVQEKIPEQVWKQIGDPNRKSQDAWDARIRRVTDPAELQTEMDSLTQRFANEEKASILENYAFVPAHPRPISYLTSMFLHTGWLHLIGNMWFLWLAGFILEDRWGRVIYPIFYLLAGIAASLFHVLFYHGSLAPVLGASGAIAALMGGFLVRFPKLKIEMMWFMLIFRVRFKAYAYWLLPMWLFMEIFYGSLFGQSTGVAHWAHVGGFIFGALAALVIQRTGLEHQANAVIEDKIGWTADPAVVQGTELLEKGKLDEAITILQRHVAAKPDALDAIPFCGNSIGANRIFRRTSKPRSKCVNCISKRRMPRLPGKIFRSMAMRAEIACRPRPGWNCAEWRRDIRIYNVPRSNTRISPKLIRPKNSPCCHFFPLAASV